MQAPAGPRRSSRSHRLTLMLPCCLSQQTGTPAARQGLSCRTPGGPAFRGPEAPRSQSWHADPAGLYTKRRLASNIGRSGACWHTRVRSFGGYMPKFDQSSDGCRCHCPKRSPLHVIELVATRKSQVLDQNIAEAFPYRKLIADVLVAQSARAHQRALHDKLCMPAQASRESACNARIRRLSSHSYRLRGRQNCAGL